MNLVLIDILLMIAVAFVFDLTMYLMRNRWQWWSLVDESIGFKTMAIDQAILIAACSAMMAITGSEFIGMGVGFLCAVVIMSVRGGGEHR